jgi:SAM-dependent methyltransferase
MSDEEIRESVAQIFGQAAVSPQGKFPFPVGRAFALSLGYDRDILEQLPVSLSESFAGVSNPLAFAELQSGESVLDLGCGAGLDTILASRQVGPGARVIGVDMSSQMLDKARQNAEAVGATNVEFRWGMPSVCLWRTARLG